MKNFFVPHRGNAYRPALFQETTVLVVSLILIFQFFSPVFIRLALPYSKFIASIIPTVLVDLANNDRGREFLGPLSLNPLLMEAARLKAEDMAKNEYFAHVSPEGKTPWYWFSKAGYTFTHAGENLAINFTDSKEVEQAWLASKTHRQNILNNNFTEIGIAAARGLYEGRETIFVVQLFGHPSMNTVPVALSEKLAGERNPQKDTSATLPAIANTPPIIPVLGQEVFKNKVEAAEQSDTFIAIENQNDIPTENSLPPSPVQQSSFASQLASSPSKISSYIYLLVGIMVLITFASTAFVEMEHRHPKHALYACFLLVLTIAGFLLNQQFIFSRIFIL